MEKEIKQQPNSCLKIVLFGPESTGKSTLAKQLAAHYKTQWVPEYMRTYLQQKWNEKEEKIAKDDLVPIAMGQITTENDIFKKATNYLFCDTNLLELQVYCEYYYDNWCPPKIKEAANKRTYDFYFLTGIDVPWTADDLRDRPFDRSTLFRNFEHALQSRNLPYFLIEGSEEERLKKAIAVLDNRFRK